jgi:hypothetical protein
MFVDPGQGMFLPVFVHHECVARLWQKGAHRRHSLPAYLYLVHPQYLKGIMVIGEYDLLDLFFGYRWNHQPPHPLV